MPFFWGPNGGSPFDTGSNNNGVGKVIIRSGLYVDGIQLQFRDGTKTAYIGGPGGTRSTFSVSAGDRINQISVWYGWGIDAIQFHTKQGKSSPKYGGPGGGLHVFSPTRAGCELVGISGRSGSLLHKIDFKWEKIDEVEVLRSKESASFDEGSMEKADIANNQLGPRENVWGPSCQASSKSVDDRLAVVEAALKQATGDLDRYKKSEASTLARLAALEEAVAHLTSELKKRDATIETSEKKARQIKKIPDAAKEDTSTNDAVCELKTYVDALDKEWAEKYRSLEKGTAIAISQLLDATKE